MKPGTKVRTLYQYSETATVVKPRARYGEGVPSPEWSIIRFDSDGKRVCCHSDMLAVRND